MKKIITTAVLALAVTALMSSAALAHCGSCGTGDAKHEKSHAEHAKAKATGADAKADMHECCIASAKEGKGCCGKDAAAVKAAYADYTAAAAAKADMHECCAGALASGKGCCGKDAAALKADYAGKVIAARL